MQFESADELSSVIARGVAGAAEWEAEWSAASAHARALLERIEAMPTGPEHISALAELQQLDLDAALGIRATAQWERANSWLQAQKMLALARTTSTLDDDLTKAAVYDISRFAHTSEHAVRAELTRTEVVSDQLGETWVALAAGLVTVTHVLALVDVVRHASRETGRAVQAAVLRRCIERGWTPGQLRRAAFTALAKIDPDGEQRRARIAQSLDSDVSFRAEPHGMASLYSRGTALPTRQMMDEINRRADEMRRAGDDRTLNQLRFEALRQAVLGPPASCDNGASDGDSPSDGSSSSRSTALLLVPLSTLLGGDQPGALEGYGPQTAPAIRDALTDDVQFRRLVFDDITGAPLEIGTHTWRPSAALVRAVRAFDRSCRVPGCTSPAVHCDIDHEIEWPDGPTTLRNCGLLCRRHHTLKTKKIYDLVSDERRNVRWISPFGYEWEGKAATYEEFLDADPPDDTYAWLPDPNPPPSERAAS